jgi:hypothetical protein
MWLQKGKTKSLNAGAFMAGFVGSIQIGLGATKDAKLRGNFA